MTRALLRAAAIHDIREIRIYSKTNHGAQAAKSYLNGLTATLDLLVRRPMAGRRETSLQGGVRSLAYRSHRIYYEIIDGSIEVLRVLHQSQDITAQFHPG